MFMYSGTIVTSYLAGSYSLVCMRIMRFFHGYFIIVAVFLVIVFIVVVAVYVVVVIVVLDPFLCV